MTGIFLLLAFLQRAEAIRQKQQQAAADAEAALFAQNPDEDYWAPRSSLPPPAGLAKAQQAWAAAAAATACNGTGQALHTQHIAASLMAPAGVQARDSQAQVLQLQLTGSTASTSVLLGTGNSAGSKWTANMSAGEPALANGFIARAVCCLKMLDNVNDTAAAVCRMKCRRMAPATQCRWIAKQMRQPSDVQK